MIPSLEALRAVLQIGYLVFLIYIKIVQNMKNKQYYLLYEKVVFKILISISFAISAMFSNNSDDLIFLLSLSFLWLIIAYPDYNDYVKSKLELNKLIIKKIEESINEKFKLSYEDSRYIISIQEGSTLAELLFFLSSKIEGFAPLSIDVFDKELTMTTSPHMYKIIDGGIVVVIDANGKKFGFGLDHWDHIHNDSGKVDVTSLFANYKYLQTYFS